MKSLSDPVTVGREQDLRNHCVPDFARRENPVGNCEPGNLLNTRDGPPKKAEHLTGWYLAHPFCMKSAMGKQTFYRRGNKFSADGKTSRNRITA